MLIDETNLTLVAGKGGDGAVTFFPGKKGPSGGKGGDGGNIYAIGDKDMADLRQYANRVKIKAENGKPGGSWRKSGRAGEDLILTFPVGTTCINRETNEELVEISDQETQYLLARGGRGGRGNSEFATSTHQVPKEYEEGGPGETVKLRLILKLIADIGLIGLPNAGKSSLLNELTNASAKTAAYAFTTLEPNLGVYARKVIADIPGLIEGASRGKGLGFKFLKHVEKVPVLLHCVSAESEDIMKDYQTIRKELGNYNEALLAKPEIVLLTKTDLIDDAKQRCLLKELSQTGSTLYPVSIYNPEQFEKLQELIKNL